VIDQAQRVRDIFSTELDKLKLADTVGYGITGPAIVPNQQGEPVIGWVFMVTIKHNVLIGQPDIGVSAPVAGVLPPDDVFAQVAKVLIEEARRLRHEASTMTPEELAARQQGGPNTKPAVPPGLLGKGFASANLAGAATRRT
jgi:hypothetical protein